MTPRSLLAALGAGVTALLVVAVVVVEALAFEFSALVGLPVGLLAGVVVAAVVAARYDDLGSTLRPVVDALAGFAYAVLALLGASYVGLPGARDVLSTDLVLVVGVVAGLAVAAASWLRDRRVESR